MPAAELKGASWRKSAYSNPNGSCVEMAELPGGDEGDEVPGMGGVARKP
jgi:hypothetical protein